MAVAFPPRFFVTGTDTGVGKTYVAALLAAGLGCAYWKPVQSGTDTDTDWVRRTAGLPADRLLPEVYRLREPLSPHEAARREGVAIDMARLALPVRERLVVEGAGGKMTDWAGQTLSLRNHQLSRGRVVAAGSSDLHAQALKVLGAPDAPAAPKEHVLPIGVVVAAGAAISAGGAALLSKIRYK